MCACVYERKNNKGVYNYAKFLYVLQSTLNFHNTVIPLTPLESGPWLKTAFGYGLKHINPLIYQGLLYINLLKYGDYEL